jgi:hypothetical protein
MKKLASLSQSVNVVVLVLGLIAMAAIFHGFDGKVEVELGIKGGKVTVIGHKTLPESKDVN